MNRVFSRLGLAAAIVAGAGTYAFAQTATTGAVSGTITDKAGAPVAGATVRLTSTQTSRTFLTGTDGSFRMGLLNPGAWTIEVTKSGFQKFSQNITVLVNQNQPVSIKMAAEAATVVEVLGTATTIDNTTTQTGLVASMDTLSAIPKGRDMNSIAMLAPGVVTGGSFGTGLGQHTDPSMGGGSGAENSYVVDGLSTTNTSRGFQGASLVTDFIDQVEIQTGGFKPEFSALGGVFNAITKSGTNEFKGSTWLTWDAIGIQAVPKKSIYFRPTDQSLNSRYDIGAEVGGPIIKDKLFFFAGVDGNITEAPNALPNNVGLLNSKDKVTTYQALAKINWYMTQDQQLTISANVNSAKDDYPLLYPTTGNANLGYNEKNDTQNFVINYDWTISPSLFFSAKLGTTQYKDTLNPSDSTDVAITDNMYFTAGGPGGTGTPFTGLAFRRGGYGYHADEDKTQTTQARADLSWFLGTHNMKFGVSQVTSKYTEIASTTGGERVTIRRTGAGAFNGVDRQFLHTNATVKAIFTAFYAQDTWDVASGLKLMYGFRYEIQDQRDLHDQTFLKFSNFNDQLQPRLGFTWDVNGDGRSKVSGSYARYFESIPQRMAIRVYANETYLRYRYSASNSTYNTATGAYAYNTAGTGPSSITDFATPFSFDPIAEGVKLPQRNEYTLGYDHTFASGWTAGIHGKYRELKNPMEDMVFTDNAGNPYDEGPAISFDGSGNPVVGAGAAVIGNPGGFQQWRPNPKSMSLYWLAMGAANPNNPPGTPAGVSYNSYGINILQYYNPATGLFTVADTHFPKAGNKYSSVDFTLDKKTDRDTFSFSYTWSRLEGNYEGVVSSSNGQADGNITASFDYYPYVGYGLLPNDRTHVVKLYASHRFDVAGNDMNLGVNWTYQSGNPVSYFDDGSSSNPPIPDLGGYGNATPQNGLLGQYGRTPALNNVDAHLDYVYKLSSKMRLIPSVDMFNVFNTRYANGIYQQATDQSGSPDVRYGQATDWQIGRRYRFGIKLQF
ncbi:MAG TPA: TonB-dependent receptor [Holophagaceae bacterium]